MSHWYRVPRAVSVRDLLAHSKRSIIVDYSVPTDLLAELPARAHGIVHLGVGAYSPQKTILLCQQSGGILLTADTEYVQLLSTETQNPWGLILLPQENADKIECLRRLSSDKLVFRPGVDGNVMVELVRHNRVFLDMRHTPPVISIFCNTRLKRY